MASGKIIPNGVVLEAHELMTVVFLTEQGYDIELIPKSNEKGSHTPDIIMEGLEWEIKCPKGAGKWLLKNTLQKAARQSANVILDLRRIKIPQEKCVSELKSRLDLAKRIRRIIIITKSKKMIDMTRKR